MTNMILEPNTQEVIDRTPEESFFYSLLPEAEAVHRAAEAVRGAHVTRPVELAPLERAGVRLTRALGALSSDRNILQITTLPGVRLPLDSEVPSSEDGLREVYISPRAISAIRVNLRSQQGFRMYEAVRSARHVLATNERYMRTHIVRRTCGETHCSCYLAAVDECTFRYQASPVLEMRLRTPAD